MLLRYLLLLSIAIYLTGAESASNLSFDRDNALKLIKGSVATRFLRAYDAFDPDRSDDIDEERVNIPGLSKVAELAQKASLKAKLFAETQQNLKWLKAKKYPGEVFGILHLGKAGTKLDGNPAFMQWLRYAKTYHEKKDPYLGAYFAYVTLKTLPEDELVGLLHSIQQTPGMKRLGDEMQVYMLDDWYLKKKLDFDGAIRVLHFGKIKVAKDDPRLEVLDSYATLLVEKLKDERTMKLFQQKIAELVAH